MMAHSRTNTGIKIATAKVTITAIIPPQTVKKWIGRVAYLVGMIGGNWIWLCAVTK